MTPTSPTQARATTTDHHAGDALAAPPGLPVGRERLAPGDAPVSLTHRALCLLAGRWLRRQGCAVVIVEPAYTRSPEVPDAIGWHQGCRSILVEAKTSRSDFLADQKKPHRAIGYLGRRRYYLTPPGLLQFDDLPEGWGLLEAHRRGVRVVVEATARELTHSHMETCLLTEQLDRLQTGRPTYLYPTPGGVTEASHG